MVSVKSSNVFSLVLIRGGWYNLYLITRIVSVYTFILEYIYVCINEEYAVGQIQVSASGSTG